MKTYKDLVEVGQEPLTDEKYLEQFILFIYRFRAQEICGVKDTKSIHIGLTENFAKLIGFKEIEDVIGRGDGEAPCKVSNAAETFYQQDRAVESQRSVKIFLDIHEYNKGLTPLRTTKTPIINPTTDNVLGTFYHLGEFTINTTLKTILNLHGRRFGSHSSMNIGDSEVAAIHLTNRELEVLFCACLGFGDRKSIANFLSFIHKREVKSETTVKDAFKALYHKLPCHNISSLVDYAMAHNLHLTIPKSFLVKGSFEIEVEVPVIK